MGLKLMTIADAYGNQAKVDAGKLTELQVPLEGFINIEEFAKEVRQAMVKTTPEGQEPDPSISQGKVRKPRGANKKAAVTDKPGAPPVKRGRKEKDKDKVFDAPVDGEAKQ